MELGRVKIVGDITLKLRVADEEHQTGNLVLSIVEAINLMQ